MPGRRRCRWLVWLLLVCVMVGLLTGCWDRVEVEDQLFALAIGVDPGAQRRYRVTLMVPVPAAVRSGVLGGGPAADGKPLMAESDSIGSAIVTINASVARRLTMRHLRSLIIGEAVARQGINELLAELLRNGEARQTAGLFVTRGITAAAAIHDARFTGDSHTGKTAEGLLLQEKYLHVAPPIRLQHAVNRISIQGTDAFLPVIGENRRVGGADAGDAAQSAQAGQLSRLEGNPIEVAGTGVFIRDRLAGFLSVDETQALLALRGEMGKAYMTIPGPPPQRKPILIRYLQENKPKRRASFQGSRPVLTIHLLFEGEVLSGMEDYRAPGMRVRVEEAARAYMQQHMETVVRKALGWRADPMGFGTLFRSQFPTWQAWDQYNWRTHLPELQVQVTAKMRIRRTGLVMGRKAVQ